MNRKEILKEVCKELKDYCNIEELEEITETFPVFDIGEEVYCVIDKAQEQPIIGIVSTIRTMQNDKETLIRYSVTDSDKTTLEFSQKDVDRIIFRSFLSANIAIAKSDK